MSTASCSSDTAPRFPVLQLPIPKRCPENELALTRHALKVLTALGNELGKGPLPAAVAHVLSQLEPELAKLSKKGHYCELLRKILSHPWQTQAKGALGFMQQLAPHVSILGMHSIYKNELKGSDPAYTLRMLLASEAPAQAIQAVIQRHGAEAILKADKDSNWIASAAPTDDLKVLQLMVSLYKDRKQVQQLLKPNKCGTTPFHNTLCNGSVQCAEFLWSLMDLESRKEALIPADDGTGLLHLAANAGSVEAIAFVRKLLGPQEVIKSLCRPTHPHPLQLAIRSGNLQCVRYWVKLVLESGDDAVKEALKQSLLPSAVATENTDIIRSVIPLERRSDRRPKEVRGILNLVLKRRDLALYLPLAEVYGKETLLKHLCGQGRLQSPLMQALCNPLKNIELLAALKSTEFLDFLSSTSQHGPTAMYRVAEHGVHQNIPGLIKVLGKKRAAAAIGTGSEYDALHQARAHRQRDCFVQLLALAPKHWLPKYLIRESITDSYWLGHDIAEYATDESLVAFINQMAKLDANGLERVLRPNKLGQSMLHMAARSGKVKGLEALVKLMEKRGFKQITQRDRRTYSPFDYLWMTGNVDGIMICSRFMSTKELHKAMLPSAPGRHSNSVAGSSPLHLLAQSRRCSDLSKLKALGPQIIHQAMTPDHYGYTPFHYAAQSGDADLIRSLAGLLSREDLSLAMRNCTMGHSPLHLAVAKGRVNAVLAVCELLEDLDPAVKQRAWVGDGMGQTPLHLATRRGNANVVGTLCPFIDHHVIDLAVGQDDHGTTALHYAVISACYETTKALINGLGMKQAARGLGATRYGQTALSASYQRPKIFEKIVSLLPHTEGPWELAEALGNEPNKVLQSRAVRAIIKKKFPKVEDCMSFLLIHKALYVARYEPTTLIQLNDKLLTLKDCPLLLGKLYRLDGHYLSTHNALQPKLLKLEKLYMSEQDEFRKDELKTQLVNLMNWEQDLFLSLAISRADRNDDEPLTSALLTLQSLADSALRNRLTQMLAKEQCFDKYALKPLLPFFKACGQSKQPKVYLLALVLLMQKGVDGGAIKVLHKAIQKLGRRAHVGQKSGRSILQALVDIASLDAFTPMDYHQLFGAMLQGDFVRSCRLVSQIIGLHGQDRLRQQAFEEAKCDLEAISTAAFQAMIPIPDTAHFATKFASSFGKQREANSLLTYASRIAEFPDTREDLGAFVHQVVEGTFHSQRYAAGRSKHLDALYKRDKTLAGKLPDLCEDMGQLPVKEAQSSSSSSQAASFPLDRHEMRKRFVDNKHMDLRRFPILAACLSGNRSASNVESDLAKVKAALLDEKAKDLEIKLEEVRFQQLLVSVGFPRNPQAQPSSLKKALASARKLSQLSAGVGEMENDLVAAMESLRQMNNRRVLDDLEVSLSDDFWDLFRIGSDVKDSCQRVDGQGAYNRCLMGYILDGKDIPIVVKKRGSDTIVARRLLRIEWNRSRRRPALYLERLYSNYPFKEIDDAIHRMAVKVSEHLHYTLYSDHGIRDSRSTLESLGSAADVVYSDAVSGVTNGIYEFNGIKVLHQPKGKK